MIPASSLKRFWQAAAFNVVIALGITAFGEHSLLSNLVYSECIGLSIWALIELGNHKLIASYDTQAHRLWWITPICGVLGYLLGSTLASILLADQGMNYLANSPRKTLGFLFFSLAAGGAITYFFLSREQLSNAREAMARTQAHMEAVQRQAAESQLKLLQTQLEPHMLFNTLANLRALISVDQARAQDMLDHMVAYLRSTLSASRATQHPLQIEFDRLHDYLELMAVRMGPRLRYTLNLPPELAQLPMPPLLLQPLVENAIKHGLEPKLEGGNISVCAQRQGEQITLEVEDTGVGLMAPDTPDDGFGLAQVRARLQTAYGPTSTLELIATSEGGTRARVTFHINSPDT